MSYSWAAKLNMNVKVETLHIQESSKAAARFLYEVLLSFRYC